jgi:hypothetical protein
MPTQMLRLLFAGFLLVPTLAQAHYLWIESTAAGAMLRFGEYEEAVHEHSPGRLDEFPAPSARRAAEGGTQSLTVERKADGFSLGKAGTGSMWVEESAVKVKDLSRSGIGIVKPMYYARYSPSFDAIPAALKLDIVPAGKPGQFAVSFGGQPLVKSSVKLIAPNGWAQEGKTDEQGALTLPMPWRGQYILQVVHLEPVAGEYDGARYEKLRHVATLSISQGKGDKTFSPDFGKP